MNTIKLTILPVMVSAILVLSACASSYTAGNSGKLPPGQVKKMTGSKSAKPYAPGQKKKR